MLKLILLFDLIFNLIRQFKILLKLSTFEIKNIEFFNIFFVKMDFKTLDEHFNFTNDRVDEEYSRVLKKGVLNRSDGDKIFIILLDLYLENREIYSEVEINVLSTIVNIRKTLVYLEFKTLYPILKATVLSVVKSNYEFNINVIDSLLNSNNKSLPEFQFDMSQFNDFLGASPQFKNVGSSICMSPTNFQEKNSSNIMSTSYQPEITFGYSLGIFLDSTV